MFRSTRVTLLAFAALNGVGCAQLELPKRGFATRYFVQSIEPQLQNEGRSAESGGGQVPTLSSDESNTGPSTLSPSHIAGKDNDASEATIRKKCVNVANKRAGDSGYQGFDGDTQKLVFDQTLGDCLKWHAR